MYNDIAVCFDYIYNRYLMSVSPWVTWGLYTELFLLCHLGPCLCYVMFTQMFHNPLTFFPLIIKDGKDKADLIDSDYLNYS